MKHERPSWRAARAAESVVVQSGPSRIRWSNAGGPAPTRRPPGGRRMRRCRAYRSHHPPHAAVEKLSVRPVESPTNGLEENEPVW